MRFLLSIGFLLSVCGCTTGFPLAFSSTPPEQRLFLQGMEEWDPSGELPSAFKTLETTYPDSPWTQKSRLIAELSANVRSQRAAISRLERDIGSCRQENRNLQQQKKSLESDQEKLKKLLIDLEKR